jgi:hypothetical protein
MVPAQNRDFSRGLRLIWPLKWHGMIARAIFGAKKVDEIVKSTLFCKVRHVLYSGIKSVLSLVESS